MKRHPADVINALIDLRKKGRSILEICEQLRLPKTTVYHHIKNVEVRPEYIERLLQRRKPSIIRSQHNWDQSVIRAQAIGDAISRRDLKLIGACLYWAEGAKADFSLSNTDPELIKLFLYALREGFKVKDNDIKISLRVYEDLDISACLRFWSGITKIQLDTKTSVYVLRGSKNGKLIYGMCRVRIKKAGLLLKEMVSIRRRMVNIIMSP